MLSPTVCQEANYSLHGSFFILMIGCVLLQVDLCFDQLVFKLSEHMFGYYKTRAARYAISLDHSGLLGGGVAVYT